MSLREELEALIAAKAPWWGYHAHAVEFIEKHGQALIDALEDGDRLDWLFKQWSGEALRNIGVVYSEPSEYRQAIDAAIKGDG